MELKGHQYFRLLSYLLGLMLLTLPLVGCDDDDDEEEPEVRQAAVRALHLSPGAPAVDLRVDGGATVAQGLEFAEASDYADVSAGTRDLLVEPADDGDVLLRLSGIELPVNTRSTAVVFDEPGALKGLALRDDASTPENDQVRLRAVHVASGVGEVDLYFNLADAEPELFLENVEFGQASDATLVDPGEYRLGLDTNDDGASEATFLLPELMAGDVLDLFVAANADNELFLLTLAPDGTTQRIAPEVQPGQAEVRAIHLSPNAPAVDVLVNEEIRAIEGLEFTNSSDYQALEAGSYSLAVVPAGQAADAAVLNLSNVELPEGTRTTAVAFDVLDSIQGVAFQDDASGLASGQLRVRVMHAAAGVGQVDIYALPEGEDPQLLLEDVDFGAVAEPLDIDAGPRTLGLDVDDDGQADLEFELPDLPAGQVVNVFAVADEEENVFLLAQLPDGTTQRIERTIQETAQLRLLHLSPNAPAVDGYVDDQLVVEGLAFPDGTPYQELLAGTYELAVTPAGEPLDAAVLTVPDVELAAGTQTTAVAFGMLDSIQALAFRDDVSELPAEQLRVRAVHVAVGVGQVDLYLLPEGEDPQLVVENLDFGAVAEAQDLDVGVRTLGIDVNDDGQVELTFELSEVPGGQVVNLYAVTDSEGNPFILRQLGDGTTERIEPVVIETAEVRVIHLSPDAPAVDVLVDEELRAVEGLAFPEATPYQLLDAGTYSFAVVPAAGEIGDAVLTVPDLQLEADSRTTVVAFDELANIQGLTFTEDMEPLNPDEVRIRPVHVAVGVGQVDIYALSPPDEPALLVENLDFGTAAEPLVVAAGQYDLGLDVDDDGTPDLAFELPELTDGSMVDLFAVADDAGDPFLLVVQPDGTTSRIDPAAE